MREGRLEWGRLSVKEGRIGYVAVRKSEKNKQGKVR